MNRKEIAKRVKTEADELEALIKKLQFRCEHLKWLAGELDSDGARPVAQNQKPVPESKFRRLIDKVYGEKI